MHLFNRNTFHKAFLFIQTETTPNENALKFRPGEAILSGITFLPAEMKTLEFMQFPKTAKQPFQSPLAIALLKSSPEGITSVLLGPDFVTISKNEEFQWVHLKPQILSLITDSLMTGNPKILIEPLTKEEHKSNDCSTPESDTMLLIRELLNTRIRPTIQDDGGDVQIVKFDEKTGTLYLLLQGSCRDCSSSVVTLKNGIEAMMNHYIPEVKHVKSVTDEYFEQIQSEINKD